MQGREIRCVFFHVELRGAAGTLALVEYADRSLAILHDDRPVKGLRWKAQELERVVAAFTRLQRKLESPPAREPLTISLARHAHSPPRPTAQSSKEQADANAKVLC